MKPFLILSMGTLMLTGLQSCGSKKPTVCTKKATATEESERRVSGPLSEKEIGWSDTDKQ